VKEKRSEWAMGMHFSTCCVPSISPALAIARYALCRDWIHCILRTWALLLSLSSSSAGTAEFSISVLTFFHATAHLSCCPPPARQWSRSSVQFHRLSIRTPKACCFLSLGELLNTWISLPSCKYLRSDWRLRLLFLLFLVADVGHNVFYYLQCPSLAVLVRAHHHTAM
jgi:hypothetical protein